VGQVTAVARSQHTLDLARELGAADDFTRDPIEAVREADLVYLATPVDVIVDLLPRVAAGVPRGALITDAGSTKRAICDTAARCMPREAEFLGGHPMAGSEEQGLAAAEADLFAGFTYFVMKPAEPLSAPVQRFYDLLDLLDTRLIVMEPDAHDRAVAAASHLPHLAAATLMNVVGALDDSGGSVLDSSGAGLRDSTRIAAGSPEMWLPICQTNQDHLVAMLSQFIETMTFLRDDLAEGRWDELGDALQRARDFRKRLEPRAGSEDSDDTETG
jgi:prephenate dehydrogenase